MSLHSFSSPTSNISSFVRFYSVSSAPCTGRNRCNRGRVGVLLVCDGCGGRIAKDKAIKRFQVRNMVDASSLRDLKEACAYDVYTLPKVYMKQSYCISCAVHRRIVRGRSAEARKIRVQPRRPRRTFNKDKKKDESK